MEMTREAAYVDSLWEAIESSVAPGVAKDTLWSAIAFHWKWVRRYNIRDDFLSLVTIAVLTRKKETNNLTTQDLRQATNWAHDEIRRQVSKHRTLLASDVPTQDPQVEEVSEKTDWIKIKRLLGSKINDTDLWILDQTLAGNSTKSIANSIEQSEANVRNRRSRAIKRIRKLFQRAGIRGASGN
jgi:DNA-directed RNA polymerase specialized sigma24 family protein